MGTNCAKILQFSIYNMHFMLRVELWHVNRAIMLVKPRHMCEGYNSRFVSVCVSVTVLVATYPVYMSKVRRHTVSCRLLKIHIVWTSLKTFPSGDMALFAYHNDR